MGAERSGTAGEYVAHVAADRLRPFVARLFVAHGVPEADAETVAEVLVEADLRGVESHGTTRIAGYLSYRAAPRIDAGLPGSFSFLPVSVTLVPSTLRIDTSLSVKLPT